MIKTKQITLIPSQIYGVYATPLIALPAPPTGYVNNILGVTEYLNYNTTQYSGVQQTVYKTLNLPNNTIYLGNILNGAGSVISPVNRQYPDKMILSTTEALYFTTDNEATNGDSQFTITIVYDQVAIS